MYANLVVRVQTVTCSHCSFVLVLAHVRPTAIFKGCAQIQQ